MKIPFRFLWLTMLFSSTLVPGAELRFASITKGESGNNRLEFVLQRRYSEDLPTGSKFIVEDGNGAATLSLIYLTLSSELRGPFGKSWLNKKVEAWPEVREILKDAANRYAAGEKERVEREFARRPEDKPLAERPRIELETIRDRLFKEGATAPTYAELEELGQWLEKNRSRFGPYTIHTRKTGDGLKEETDPDVVLFGRGEPPSVSSAHPILKSTLRGGGEIFKTASAVIKSPPQLHAKESLYSKEGEFVGFAQRYAESKRRNTSDPAHGQRPPAASPSHR